MDLVLSGATTSSTWSLREMSRWSPNLSLLLHFVHFLRLNFDRSMPRVVFSGKCCSSTLFSLHFDGSSERWFGFVRRCAGKDN